MRKILVVSLVQAICVSGFIAINGSLMPVAAQENRFDTTVDVRMGQRLFRAQCGRCHGRDATGNDETGAPDLTTGTFANASSDEGLFQVIREGIDGTAMIGISPRASDQTVWQIVSYVNSLNLDPEDYNLPGNVNTGQQIYNGKGNCANCHMVNGTGGRRGPDLSTVANRREPDELHTDLLSPNEHVEPRWWTIRVTREDGSVIEGLRMNEDTFTLRIMDENENLWHFSKSQIRSSERIMTTTMPSYDNTLTANEVDDLVAYLFSLRRAN